MSQLVRNDKKKKQREEEAKIKKCNNANQKTQNNNVMSNDLTKDKTQKNILKMPLDEGAFLISMMKCKAQVAIVGCY